MNTTFIQKLHIEQILLYIIGFGLCELLIKYMKWNDRQQLYFYLFLLVPTMVFIYHNPQI